MQERGGISSDFVEQQRITRTRVECERKRGRGESKRAYAGSTSWQPTPHRKIGRRQKGETCPRECGEEDTGPKTAF